MSIISKFINYILLLLALALTSYGLSNLLIGNKRVALILMLLLCLVFTLTFFKIERSSNKKRKIAFSQKQAFEKFSLELEFMEEISATNLVNKYVFPQESHSNSAKTLIFFDKPLLELTDFAKLVKPHLLKNSLIHIFSIDVDKSVELISQKLKSKVVFINAKDLFLSLGENPLPEIPQNFTQEALTFKDKIKPMLARSKAVGYASLSIFFVAFSFLSPYKVYYLVFAIALFIISAVVFFAKIS